MIAATLREAPVRGWFVWPLANADSFSRTWCNPHASREGDAIFTAAFDAADFFSNETGFVEMRFLKNRESSK